MQKLLESFDLSEDDIARVAQIFDTHRQAAANWHREHGDELQDIKKAMQKARKDRDPEAMKAAHERMKKLMESRKETVEDVFVQLGEVLSKEQLAKVKALMGSPRRGAERGTGGRRLRILNAALEKLNLDDKKKAAIKDIQTAVAAKLEKLKVAIREAETRQEKAKLGEAFGRAEREAWKKIHVVLGEDLTAELHKIARRISRQISRQNDLLSGLGLSDEQKAKIARIRRSAGEKMKDAADRRAKRAIVAAMRKEIDAVLTEDQKARLREAISNRRKGERNKAEK